MQDELTRAGWDQTGTCLVRPNPWFGFGRPMARPTRPLLTPIPRFACPHSFSPWSLSLIMFLMINLKKIKLNQKLECLICWFMNKFYSSQILDVWTKFLGNPWWSSCWLMRYGLIQASLPVCLVWFGNFYFKEKYSMAYVPLHPSYQSHMLITLPTSLTYATCRYIELYQMLWPCWDMLRIRLIKITYTSNFCTWS
jgi:hypothetical protein